MPIYEYSCEDCGNQFEKLVRRAAEADGVECPSCGKKQLKQELSVFAAHANGHAKAGRHAGMPERAMLEPGHVRDELTQLRL